MFWNLHSFKKNVYFIIIIIIIGVYGGVVIKALRYKPAGRGFDSR